LSVVGIVTALAAEARAFPIAERSRGTMRRLADGSLLIVGGIGPAAAAAAARSVLAAGATALASSGFAGGLEPALRAGTILLPGEVISAAGAAYATTEAWRLQLWAALAGHAALAEGRLLSTARMIDDVAGKSAALRGSGAAAVDMESVAVAEVAAAHGMPFLAARVIVDTAADTLPRAVLAATRSGHLRIGRLIGGLMLAPAELAGLLRLAQRYRAANRSLELLARVGLRAPPGTADAADAAGAADVAGAPLA